MSGVRGGWQIGTALPRYDRESWTMCVKGLLPRVGIEAREADLENRRRHARLLAVAALREAGEDCLADSLERCGTCGSIAKG